MSLVAGGDSAAEVWTLARWDYLAVLREDQEAAHSERLALLDQVPLFQQLSARVRDQLADLLEERSFDAGSVVCREVCRTAAATIQDTCFIATC